MNYSDYYHKVHGGWLGRVVGSHFGAPLEFRPRWHSLKKFGIPIDTDEREISYFVKPVDPKDVNDDEIYQIVGLIALEKYGPNLTAKEIGEEWKHLLYKEQYTAEKIALNNLLRGIDPPECASLENGNIWFDAIGAQMKADIWGLVTPGCPMLAVDYAQIDGSIAHQGIGIDGEVFIAAIISQAFTESDVNKLIVNALQLLPKESMYRHFIEQVIVIFHHHPQSIQWQEARKKVMQAWNMVRWQLYRESRVLERKNYLRYSQGVHVLPNAGIIVLSLLYAQNHVDPFGRAISLAGMMGLDTDCNCGNLGTIMGTILGADQIPKKWILPLQDTFHTYVRGYEDWKISELAQRISQAGQQIVTEKCPERIITN